MPKVHKTHYFRNGRLDMKRRVFRVDFEDVRILRLPQCHIGQRFSLARIVGEVDSGLERHYSSLTFIFELLESNFVCTYI